MKSYVSSDQNYGIDLNTKSMKQLNPAARSKLKERTEKKTSISMLDKNHQVSITWPKCKT